MQVISLPSYTFDLNSCILQTHNSTLTETIHAKRIPLRLRVRYGELNFIAPL